MPEFISHNIEAWGTVIAIQAPKELINQEIFYDGCRQASEYYKEIDCKFSTYRDDSEVSLIRSEELEIKDASPEVKFVWNMCLELREFTNGAFDPWAVKGGFDPSGFVKGWASQQSLSFFPESKVPHLQINAGGDIILRGGVETNKAWKIGVRHPELKDEVAKIYELFDGTVASSGTYERGEHIIDPRVGAPAVGARAATVVGPDGGVADALATALIVDGRDAATWIGNNAFENYSFWAVDKIGEGSWSYTNS